MNLQDETNTVLENESHTPLTHADFQKYCGKLRLLSHVHNDIADKLNAKRVALDEIFFRPEDKFIDNPEPEDLVGLMLSVSTSHKHKP